MDKLIVVHVPSVQSGGFYNIEILQWLIKSNKNGLNITCVQ